MIVQEFIKKPALKLIDKGSFTWSSPSNIALVKYWGKKDHQIPANPSISFTLDTCRTTTTLNFEKKEKNDEFSFDVFLEGEQKDDFKPKIETFFNRIEPYLSFLKEFHFTITTSNSFPHLKGKRLRSGKSQFAGWARQWPSAQARHRTLPLERTFEPCNRALAKPSPLSR